jgi:hypothetical protein
MPIKDKSVYSEDWPETSKLARERAGNRCEICRVHQYAVGYRQADGSFYQNRGNLHCDASGYGEHPNGEPLTYSEAREFANQYNHCFVDGSKIPTDDDGNRWIVIVLTVHHKDFNPGNNDPQNLACLCQRCHNTADIEFRCGNRKSSRLARMAAGSLFEVNA